MTPVDFKGSNITLAKPDGWTDEQCVSIQAERHVMPSGTYSFLVKFRLSDLDVINLRAGSLIIVELTCDYAVMIAIDTRKLPLDCPHYAVINKVMLFAESLQQRQQMEVNRTLWIRITGVGFPPIKVYTRVMENKN